jgi:DNA-directed RNA polymerase sigma subunit (sigma70/sigma32)
MKKNKPNGIPLETLFIDPSFQRHFEILMRENPGDTKLQKAIMSELIDNASKNVTRKQKHAKASVKGGIGAAKAKADELASRNEKIISHARKLLENKRDRRVLSAIIATQYNLSDRRVRDILKKAGI